MSKGKKEKCRKGKMPIDSYVDSEKRRKEKTSTESNAEVNLSLIEKEKCRSRCRMMKMSIVQNIERKSCRMGKP